ncbi:MAG: pyridoxamine 5'-phosphate oxidase family protein [Hyphomonas sp.]|nr:pyridoxamine 5'-phosphate oxidase family protein [Hyphomonas sp.]
MSELRTQADFRTVYKPPSGGAVGKDIARIDDHFARFIALSPFLCIGSSGEDGLCDVSPRGGEPGFVHVIDEMTLAMPDRPGNNRLDSMSNLTARPGVGLLFFIPGFEDCLRVNGFARMSIDEALMRRFDHDGKPPRSVMLIDVKEAYFHCPKAIKRAGLWDPATQVDRATFPSPGQILRDQMKLDVPARAIDDAIDQNARDELY